MGRIEDVELHPYRKAYRFRYNIEFTEFNCSLEELKKKLIEDYNKKMKDWVNESSSERQREIREQSYDKYHLDDISFWMDGGFYGIII